MSCHRKGRDRTRLHTLLVQQNVQALLGAVLLELSVGDELRGHGGTVGMEEEEGEGQRSRTGTSGVMGDK